MDIYKDKETLKYRMTYKICGLSNHILNNSDLVTIASQSVKELSAKLRECACLAIEQNYSIVYIYVSDGRAKSCAPHKESAKKRPCIAPALAN